jgi:DoxX-like family
VQPHSTVGSSRLRRTTYWIATIGLAWELSFGGLSDVMRLQYVRVIVTHLGYPLYVLTIIGVWKLLATIALLAPRFPLLKEWAYAGSFFVFSGAVTSHIAAGDGFGHWVGPGIGAAVTVISWGLRPPSRRVSVEVSGALRFASEGRSGMRDLFATELKRDRGRGGRDA